MKTLRYILFPIVLTCFLLHSQISASDISDLASGDSHQRALLRLAAGQDATIRQILAAHADIARNRNNEALRLFVSLDKQAHESWLAWAEQLGCGREHATPLACYLLGDARARKQDWEGALTAFDASLALDEDFALALIGRGTLLAMLGRTEPALEDFQSAVQKAPMLSEGHNALGGVLVMRGAARGAQVAFRRARELSPNYVLAENGTGCAAYGLGDWDVAHEHFLKAASSMEMPVVADNFIGLAGAIERRLFTEGEHSPMFHPGDFRNWAGLQSISEDARSVIHLFLGEALPATPDLPTMRALNRALGDKGFIQRLERMNHLSRSSDDTLRLHVENGKGDIRSDILASPNGLIETYRINRAILERFYPEHLVRHSERQPGMFVDTRFETYHEHRDISFSGGGHDFTEINANRGGVTFATPGGVTAKAKDPYFDRGNWPVSTMLGLAYTAPIAKPTGRRMP